MATFRVSINHGPAYSVEAANSWDAWDLAFAANPEAAHVDITPAWLMPDQMLSQLDATVCPLRGVTQ